MTHLLIILWCLFVLLVCFSRKIWEDTLFSAMPPFIWWLDRLNSICTQESVLQLYSHSRSFTCASIWLVDFTSKYTLVRTDHSSWAGLQAACALTGLPLGTGPVFRQVHTWLIPNKWDVTLEVSSALWKDEDTHLRFRWQAHRRTGLSMAAWHRPLAGSWRQWAQMTQSGKSWSQLCAHLFSLIVYFRSIVQLTRP